MKAIVKDFEWTLKYDFGETTLVAGKTYTVYFDIKLRCMCVGQFGKLSDTQLLIATIQLETSKKGEFKEKLKPIIDEYHKNFICNKGEAIEKYGWPVVCKVEPQFVKGIPRGGFKYQYNTHLFDYIAAHPDEEFKYSIKPKPKKVRKLSTKELQARQEARFEALMAAVVKTFNSTKVVSELTNLVSHSDADFESLCECWYRETGHKYISSYRYGDKRLYTVLEIEYPGMEQKEKITIDVKAACTSLYEWVTAHIQEAASILQLTLDGELVRSWYNGYSIISKKGAEYCKAVKEACFEGCVFDGFMWRFKTESTQS